MEERVITLLLGIKGDVGALRGEVGELRGTLQSRPCLLHQEEIRDLRGKAADVDGRVDLLHQKDLPEIRQALALQAWWSTRRGKLMASLVGLLLAIVTGVTTALVVRGLEAEPVKEKAAVEAVMPRHAGLVVQAPKE